MSTSLSCSEPERKQKVYGGSHAQAQEIPETISLEPVHRLIEMHAAYAPTAVAVRFRDQSLTYDALNCRANQLAQYLALSNIGRGRYVVVCVEPALDIVVALLAILKAGAVYVPLDPAYPAARIQAILKDTRPDLVITQSRLIERLALHGETTLAIDAAAPLLSGLSTDNVHLRISPEDTAHVYYTSGTTGTPKGVMASYANLSSYIRVAQERYCFTSRDVMPAIARFSFSTPHGERSSWARPIPRQPSSN